MLELWWKEKVLYRFYTRLFLFLKKKMCNIQLYQEIEDTICKVVDTSKLESYMVCIFFKGKRVSPNSVHAQNWTLISESFAKNMKKYQETKPNLKPNLYIVK